eukprot:275030-Ditylum_brightwellii.AAC.1
MGTDQCQYWHTNLGRDMSSCLFGGKMAHTTVGGYADNKVYHTPASPMAVTTPERKRPTPYGCCYE